MRAPTFELLKFNINGVNKFKTHIPEYREVLTDVTYLKDGFFGLQYLQNGDYSGLIVDKDGKAGLRIPTNPGYGIEFYHDSTDNHAYFDLTTFYLQNQVYRLNLKRMNFEFHEGHAVSNLSEKIVEVAQIPNKNGNKIPTYIIYTKNKVKKNRNNTAVIKVYGGYGITQEPYFSYLNMQVIDNGGILVFPGVRGSGALGTQWAMDGRGLNKQNTIDDIISTAEYLINKKLTSPSKIILEGGSHGGFAVTAAAIQRPDLFKGVIADAGVHDLVWFTDETVGNIQLNRVEFGDPDDPETFQSRLSLSPIHNLKKGVKYPSFLILTGSNDSRVSPSNSYRFYAMLNKMSSNRLNFLHVTNGGHNVATFPYENLYLTSFKYSFIGMLTGSKFWN